MIRTVIVEDDPMVAQINCQYLRQLEGFRVDGVFHNGKDALDHLRAHTADLVILDVYMPGISGVELLRLIRAENIKSSIIMVTAATEMGVVEEALRLGVVDYLVKPFSFARFRAAVEKHLIKSNLMKSGRTVDQELVDRLMSPDSCAGEPAELRKGLNQKTLEHIYQYLREHTGEEHTCDSISAALNISKVTIRRYLNYLIETGKATSSIDYTTGGRPGVLYQLKR